tara:strand:+ start:11167 stop:12957 length:1791 start_codon:yes stop_codon:yes gene_type:complete
MEVGILSALVGFGWLYNEKNKNNNPINNVLDSNIAIPNGDNIYNSEHYNVVDEEIRTLAKDNFEASHEEDSGVINHQKLDRIGSNLNQPLNESLESKSKMEGLKEDLSKLTYSTAAGGYIPKSEFLKNDHGIGVSPYFKGSAPTIENFESSRTLATHQGGNENEFYQEKKEMTNFFPLEQQQVFGNTFGEGIGDPNRYDTGILKTNQLPFTQERIQHIDTKSDMNRKIGEMIAESTNIDKLRSEDNPKLTYKSKVLSGKAINESRGKIGEVNKNDPETFYENRPERWLRTTGAFLEKTQREETIMKDTNRAFFNKGMLGPAAPTIFEGQEKRAKVRKPLKNQLCNDTVRNLGSENPLVSTDIQQESYYARPNERDVTTLRNYQSNLKGGIDALTLGIQDPIKKTKKQTTLTPKQNGFMDNGIETMTLGIQDNIRKTKKQTTINNKHNGNLIGDYQKNPSGYEPPEITTKDTLMFNYTGSAGGFMKGNTSKDNYNNAETNPTKEIIAQGREPTLNNVKLANGKESTNIVINKLDYDYMNHYQSGVEKIYQPKEATIGDVTTMKDKLNDERLAIRIDPILLNPFRENPYTQSLESFAY